MRYKVGDIVRVKKGLVSAYYESKGSPGKSLWLAPYMKRFCNKVGIITKVEKEDCIYPEAYYLSITDDEWIWSSEMLESMNNSIMYYLNERSKGEI